MKTSKPLTHQTTLDELIFSQVDSPANLSQMQDLEKERKMTATYGRRCLESFGKFPRATLWAKTFAAYLIGQGDWYSSKCALIWKMKATKSHRIYFQLRVKTHPTEGIEFGLLPTVTSQVRERTLEECQDRQKKYGGEKRALYLDHFAAMGMLPTPRAVEVPEKDSAKLSKDGKKVTRDSGQTFTTNLSTRAKFGMLPTPLASEGGKMSGGPTENQMSLSKMARQQTGKTSQLNPLFVEEMMGFPKNWTVLPFQSGEKKV